MVSFLSRVLRSHPAVHVFHFNFTPLGSSLPSAFSVRSPAFWPVCHSVRPVRHNLIPRPDSWHRMAALHLMLEVSIFKPVSPRLPFANEQSQGEKVSLRSLPIGGRASFDPRSSDAITGADFHG